MKLERCTVLIAAALFGLCPGGVQAQRLADWPVRISALPDALTTGAVAAFWNPAALGGGVQRSEFSVLHLRAPQIWELSGLAGAAAARLYGMTLAAAYKHIGMPGFTRTEDSPAGDNFDLGEHHFSLAAARTLRGAFALGALARYTYDNLQETDGIVGFGAGVSTELDDPLRATLGAFAVSEDGAMSWGAGVEVYLPPVLGPRSNIGLAYGIQHDVGIQQDILFASPVHRIAAQLDWEGRAWVSAGVTREPDGEQARWAPILAASLRLNRYTLGIVRESLVNDIGATLAFRLQINFGQPLIGLSQ
jgi:hypothetical protein